MSNRPAGRPPLLAAVVLSACVGLVGGAGAAWALYQRLGPAERIVSSPAQPGGGQSAPTYESVAASAAPSVVKLVTRPVGAGDLLGTPSGFAVGFVVSSDGLVVTSAHAVAGATRLTVSFADGRTAAATVAATDLVHGIVVLRAVGIGGLTPLAFADFDRAPPRPGTLALAVGSPPFAPISVASGTVSAVDRSLDLGGSPPESVVGALTVDAAPDPADDGAPLLDGAGHVVGVVVPPPPAGPASMVALSGRAAAELVDALEHGAAATRPTLGLQALLLDPATAAAAGVRPGALVRSVDPGGPAAVAGLRPGDVVVAVDGVAVDADHQLDAASLGLTVGQRVTLTVVRAGREQSVPLTVAGG